MSSLTISSSSFHTTANDNFIKSNVQKECETVTLLASASNGLQEQDLRNFDTDYDSDSVSSYETALEDFDQDEDTNTVDIEEDGFHSEWSQLIRKHGAKPGAMVNYGDRFETSNMDISLECRIAPIVADQVKIEEFSGARLTLMRCHNPLNDLTLRFEGFVKQVNYAMQACNASIADNYQGHEQAIYVILKLEGPRLLPKIAAFRIMLRSILSEKGFVSDDSLHITIASLRLRRMSEVYYLIEAVADVARLLNQAYHEAPMSMIGQLGNVRACNLNFISVTPKEDNDPINAIVYMARQLLQEKYGFRLVNVSRPHMTLYLNRHDENNRVGYSWRIKEKLPLVYDFGPVRIASVEVSRHIPALNGDLRFSKLASYSLYLHRDLISFLSAV